MKGLVSSGNVYTFITPNQDLYSCIFRSCSWLGLIIINVNKFPPDNFHLQDPSTITESSEMSTKSRYLPIREKPFRYDKAWFIIFAIHNAHRRYVRDGSFITWLACGFHS